MITMDQIHRIRDLFFQQGKNLAEIACTGQSSSQTIGFLSVSSICLTIFKVILLNSR